jgi:hypothetical protein
LLARKQFIERALAAPAPSMVTMTAPSADPAPAMTATPPPPEVAAQAFQARLRALEQARSVRIDATRWLAADGFAAERPLSAALRAQLESDVLSVPPTTHGAEGALALDVLRAALLDPAYQLK